VVTYLNPAVAVALGAVILGERLTPVTGVSFVLILAGSVLATRASAGISLSSGRWRNQTRPSAPARETSPGTGLRPRR
jgi:drug/metabolite transporter (DMT)-like permease